MASEEILKAEIGKVVEKALADFTNSSDLSKTVSTELMAQLERPDSPLAQVKGLQASLKKDIDGLEERVRSEIKIYLEALEVKAAALPREITSTWKQLDNGRGYELLTTVGEAMTANLRSDPEYTRSITTYDETPGARQGALSPWQQMLERNPFRQFVSYYGAAGEAAVTLPNLTQAEFVDTSNTGVNIPDALAVTSATHTLMTQSMQTFASVLSESHVPGLRPVIQSMIGMKAANAHGANCAGVIEGSVEAASGFSNVATGVASSSTKLGLPASPTDSLADLKAALDTPYASGGVYFCTRAFYAALKKATSGAGGAWAYDPSIRAERFDGTPIIATSHIADASSATAATVAFYGDLSLGVILAESVPLRISEFTETRPGANTYFAQMQYLYIVADTNAVVGLVTGT